MKKLFFVFAIATAFVACNSGESKEATADTTVAAADTTVAAVDTTAAAPAMDTTAKADTTKKP